MVPNGPPRKPASAKPAANRRALLRQHGRPSRKRDHRQHATVHPPSPRLIPFEKTKKSGNPVQFLCCYRSLLARQRLPMRHKRGSVCLLTERHQTAEVGLALRESECSIHTKVHKREVCREQPCSAASTWPALSQAPHNKRPALKISETGQMSPTFFLFSTVVALEKIANSFGHPLGEPQGHPPFE